MLSKFNTAPRPIGLALSRNLTRKKLPALARHPSPLSVNYFRCASAEVTPGIGSNEKFLEVVRSATKYAASNSSVLITGESGTGKEVMAHFLKGKSRRANEPYFALNCAAIPENLLESELFGHEKGAFTGATAQRIGKFEKANGGTIFLDEIATMSNPLQSKLLRALDPNTGSFERVGGNKTIRVDVRIIAATNAPLPLMIQSGEFRQDLFYRIAVLDLALPPLRERLDDIPLLVPHFLELWRAKNADFPEKTFSPEAIARMQEFTWPGNIRELSNCVERLCLLAPDKQIQPDDVDRHRPEIEISLQPLTLISQGLQKGGFEVKMAAFAQLLILKALQKHQGNEQLAAAELQITVKSLREFLRNYEKLLPSARKKAQSP